MNYCPALRRKGRGAVLWGIALLWKGSEEGVILEMYDELENDMRGRLLGYLEGLRGGGRKSS